MALQPDFLLSCVTPELVVQPLFTSGTSSNRVDIVFFGDGYTASEQTKFQEDARRLTTDMIANQTFVSVTPLINVWAAFSPSEESGIGFGGRPKNTTYGLYRDGTELRAIYCSKEDVARAACNSLGDACDYPILLGNDPLYGGLGGEFSITTASQLNGALVLRHELGHSIIEEGEEYDGGFVYEGPNSADSLTEPFKWQHWLTTDNSPPRAERAVVPIQAYPWTMLNPETPYRVAFNSSGLYCRYLVKFSLSGIPHRQDLRVELDGEDLGWEPWPDIGLDRWHYDIPSRKNASLGPGEHEIAFHLANTNLQFAQLCSVEVIEYGDETEFNTSEAYIGAFPTYSMWNTTTYRPTNQNCLMRTVTHPNFCPVCMEGLWLQLLKKVSLIDSIAITRHPSIPIFSVKLHIIRLGPFRDLNRTTQDEDTKIIVSGAEFYSRKETMAIRWYKNEQRIDKYDNLLEFTLQLGTLDPIDTLLGKDATVFADDVWRVEVEFTTDAVRKKVDGLLTANRTFTLPGSSM